MVVVISDCQLSAAKQQLRAQVQYLDSAKDCQLLKCYALLQGGYWYDVCLCSQDTRLLNVLQVAD